ncbi:MAG: leucine-rich repeat protein [Oscillospiraceae bacterium]|nr:leucine-rich repeat protein [Oscillospiraceae bacterium]
MKKKIIAGVLVASLMGGGVPYCNYYPIQFTAILASAEATVIPADKLNYTEFDEYVQINYVTYSSSNCPAEVEFPSQINGKPVEVIGNGGMVFNYSSSINYGYKTVQKIKIPSTVKTISANAFKNCYKADTIEIPSSVTSIGDYAFYSCASLLSILIPASGGDLTIGDGAFMGCSMLTRVNLPDRITSMGAGCFTSCSNLTNIVLPDSITTLKTLSSSGTLTGLDSSGKSVNFGAEVGFFENCSNLGSIEIPDSVQNMDERTFKSCTSLSEITIGAGIEALGAIDLESTVLKKINVSQENPVYSSENGILFDKSMKRLIRFPVDCDTVKYVIPSTVTEIDKNAFTGSKDLTYIIFPESVSEIPQGLFNNCSSLKKIMILNTACEINAEFSSDIEIAGYAGSTAEKYATQMSYTFIDIAAEDEPVPSEPSTAWNGVIPDVNGDGSIDAIDASIVLVYAAEYGAGKVSSFQEFAEQYFGEDTPETTEEIIEETEVSSPIWVEQLQENFELLGNTSSQYAILYIDDDDSPEILVHSDEPEPGVNNLYTAGTGYTDYVMQFDDGPGIRFGGYSEKENLFWTDEGSGDGSASSFYRLENGTPVALESFLRMSDSEQMHFYVNDTEVSESEFNDSYDAYPHDSSDYTYLSYSEFKDWVEQLAN